jgi:hypothetical protein
MNNWCCAADERRSVMTVDVNDADPMLTDWWSAVTVAELRRGTPRTGI